MEITHAHQTALPNDPTKDVSADAWNEGHDVTGVLAPQNGGTGFANVSTFLYSGFDLAFVLSGPTTLSLPTTGTLVTQAAADSTYQPLDADLTAIAALSTTGFMARTAAATYTPRTITGTANRLSVSGGDGISGNPTLNIHTSYVGQNTITTLGTIATGVWNATLIIGTYGGTGVNNATRTMTYAGNVAFTGAFNPTFASSASVTHTLPGVAGTLATLAGTETFTNKTLTAPTLTTPALGTPASGNLSSCTADGTDAVGFRNVPQNSRSAAYTTVLADAGKHIYHPGADTTARIWTIDSNANVAYPIPS